MSQQKPQFFRFNDKPADSKLTISGNDSSNLSSTIVSDTSSIVFNGDYVKVPKDTKFLMNSTDPDLDAHPNRLVSKIVHSIDVVSELKKDPNFQNYYTLLESKVIAAGAQNQSVSRSVLDDIKDQIDDLVDDRAEMVHLYGNAMLANGHKNLSTVSASSNLDLSKAGIIKNNADLIFNNINGSGYQESLFQQYKDHYLPELLKVSNDSNSGYQHIVDQQDPYKNLTLNAITHLQRSNAEKDCELVSRRAQNIDFAVRKEYQTGVDFIKMVKESVDVDINFSELRMRQNWLPDNKTIHFKQFFDNGPQDLYSGGPVTDQGDLTQGTNANDAPHTFSEGDVTITIQNTYIKRMHDASLDVTNTNGIKIVSGSLTSYRFGGDFNGLVEDIGDQDITSDQLQKNATSGSNLVEKLSMPNVWVLASNVNGSGFHAQTIELIEANVSNDTTTGLPSDWENAVCAVQDSTSNSLNPTYYSVDNLGANGMSGNPVTTNNTVIFNENTANESIFNDMVNSMQNLDLLHYIE